MISASNVELLDIILKNIAATGKLAWTPTSNVLPDDIERQKEGLSKMSTDSYSPDNDDDSNEVETPNPKQPLNPLQPTQDKGKKLALPLSTQGKGKKWRSSNKDETTT